MPSVRSVSRCRVSPPSSSKRHTQALVASGACTAKLVASASQVEPSGKWRPGHTGARSPRLRQSPGVTRTIVADTAQCRGPKVEAGADRIRPEPGRGEAEQLMTGAENAGTGEFVRLEVADGVGTIRLDRPKMNALNVQVQEEIRAAATEASARDDVKAVVVYGGERVFAAGADIKEMAEMSYTDMVKRSGALQSALSAVARIPKPVVAAVTGYALGGGCELALCADVRFAAEDAVLGQPEILLGVIPGAGGTHRLTRVVGPSRDKDIIFTGRFVKADEALAIGLVDRVLPADRVYDEAVAWARQFSGAARYALRAAKEAIDRGLEADLDTGLAIERQQFAGLFATEDRRIGMTSFVENGPGKARFEGR